MMTRCGRRPVEASRMCSPCEEMILASTVHASEAIPWALQLADGYLLENFEFSLGPFHSSKVYQSVVICRLS